MVEHPSTHKVTDRKNKQLKFYLIILFNVYVKIQLLIFTYFYHNLVFCNYNNKGGL